MSESLCLLGEDHMDIGVTLQSLESFPLGPGKLAQWIMLLPLKREDQVYIPSTHVKVRGRCDGYCNPIVWEPDRGSQSKPGSRTR